MNQRIKPTLPTTIIQDLRQWGSRHIMESQRFNNSAPTEAARVTLEEPRNIQVTIQYSTPYSVFSNDTRAEITYGVGTTSSTVQVQEGVHVFPCQNLHVVLRRFDDFTLDVPHPACSVEVYCTLTDDPPSWVLYDEVP